MDLVYKFLCNLFSIDIMNAILQDVILEIKYNSFLFE